jgi:CBS domain-containing protein
VLSGDTVLEAAKIMLEQDVGFLPIGRDDRLVGVITDRDIVVRVVAQGRDPAQVKVDEAMSPQIRYCYDDEPIDHVARNMAELNVSRLAVMNRDRRLVGVVSIDDILPLTGTLPGSYSPTLGTALP